MLLMLFPVMDTEAGFEENLNFVIIFLTREDNNDCRKSYWNTTFLFE